MFTTLDKKKQIGWTISILIPLIIAFIPVSENFTVSLKLFFYDYAVYDTDYRV